MMKEKSKYGFPPRFFRGTVKREVKSPETGLRSSQRTDGTQLRNNGVLGIGNRKEFQYKPKA